MTTFPDGLSPLRWIRATFGTAILIVLVVSDALDGTRVVATLVGESGYDGLTLFLLLTPGEEGGSGLIVPTANVPPVPELPAE